MPRRCKKCKIAELEPAAKCTDIIEKKGYCSTACLASHMRDKRIAKENKAVRARNAADRARIETLQQCITKAQADINKFITTYDKLFYGKCIASDEAVSDCGHFYHRGSKYRTSWITMFHGNLHGQGAHSNRYSGGGDSYNYRLGIIKRYGKDYLKSLIRFKRLEDWGEMPKPTKDQVRACAKWHRDMTKIYIKIGAEL